MNDSAEKPSAVEFAARLQKAMNHASIPAHGRGAWLAGLTGVSAQSASFVLRGRNRPMPDKTEIIAKACGVQYAWLRRGEGPMLAGIPAPDTVALSPGTGQYVPTNGDWYYAFRRPTVASTWAFVRIPMWRINADGSATPMVPSVVAAEGAEQRLELQPAAMGLEARIVHRDELSDADRALSSVPTVNSRLP